MQIDDSLVSLHPYMRHYTHSQDVAIGRKQRGGIREIEATAPAFSRIPLHSIRATFRNFRFYG